MSDSKERTQSATEQASAEDSTVFRVVVNHEEQYSVWPADRDLPLGWKEQGTTGSRAECLEAINGLWTDMRPLSLRRKMDELEDGGAG